MSASESGKSIFFLMVEPRSKVKKKKKNDTYYEKEDWDFGRWGIFQKSFAIEIL